MRSTRAGVPPLTRSRRPGADGIRLVAFDNPDFFAYAEKCLGWGLEVGVVLARESFPTTDYAGFAAFYAERLVPTLWCVGNEMDSYLNQGPSDSSWSMRPAEYASGLWHPVATTILDRQPEAKLVVGGLVSGQPWWASGLKPLLDPAPWGWDAHPYGKPAAEAEALLQLYKEATDGARWCVLEWDRPAAEIAEYLAMLRRTTVYDAQFCYSDSMVDGFGIVTADGTPKPEYYAYQAACGDDPVEPNDETKKTMADFEAQGGVVGTIYNVDEVGEFEITSTDAGLFVWRRTIPGCQILLDARAHNPFE
jgi:hypothetical protein